MYVKYVPAVGAMAAEASSRQAARTECMVANERETRAGLSRRGTTRTLSARSSRLPLITAARPGAPARDPAPYNSSTTTQTTDFVTIYIARSSPTNPNPAFGGTAVVPQLEDLDVGC